MQGLKARLWVLWATLFGPTPWQLVPRLVEGVSGLELTKGNYQRLAPISGVWGSIKIEGNAIPVFTYYVFDKALMEFVEVKAIVSLPDQIAFEATTQDLGHVPVLAPYIAPFHRLSRNLFRYFPLPMPEKPKEEAIHAG